jgi:hypothetical protein
MSNPMSNPFIFVYSGGGGREVPFPGDKRRPGPDADHSHHLVPMSWMSRSYTTSPPCASVGVLWDCFLFPDRCCASLCVKLVAARYRSKWSYIDMPPTRGNVRNSEMKGRLMGSPCCMCVHVCVCVCVLPKFEPGNRFSRTWVWTPFDQRSFQCPTSYYVIGNNTISEHVK